MGVAARKKRALTGVAAGLAGLSLGGLAQAADATGAADAAIATADDQAGTVTGVEVQGQITKQNNPKVTADPLNNPQTVTVVPRGVIAAQNLLSLRDILSIVPGITFGAGEGGGGFGDSINLRGYTATNDITLDNVRDGAQYSRTDAFNIEQIEVTNGANGVYSGAGSVGGTINIVSKRPTMRDSRTVGAGVGTENYRRGTLDVNQTLNAGVAVRLNAMVHRNDAPGRDVEEFERWGVAPAITFGLDGPTQFTAMYFHQEDRNVPQYGVPFFNGRPLPGVSPHRYFGYSNIDRADQDVDIATGILDHDFGGGLKVRALLRYQDVDALTVVDAPQGTYCLADGQKPVAFSQTTAATNITGFAPCLATDPAPGFYQPSGPRGRSRDANNELLHGQVDLTWEGVIGGMEHTLVVGVAAFEEDYRLNTGEVLRAANGAVAPLPPMSIADPNNIYAGPINFILTSIQNGARSNQAIYLFDNIVINEQWSINGGIRYEHNEASTRTDAYNTTGPDLGTVLTRGPELGATDDLLTWRIGVVFKPIPNASLYVAYANSETPSQATVSGACTLLTCNIDPEQAESFEIGAKWDYDGRLSLTAAIFRNDRTNYRVASNDPQFPAGTQVLDGSARVDGVALGVTGRITDRWEVFANYTYLKSEVLRGASEFLAARGQDFTRGDDLLGVPDHAFSFFTTYDVSEQWEVGYGVTYQGEYYLSQHGQITGSDPPARTTIPRVKAEDYWVHRVTAAWTPIPELELRLNVNNLFDKVYFTRARTNLAGWATPGDRRNATLTANYRF